MNLRRLLLYFGIIMLAVAGFLFFEDHYLSHQPLNHNNIILIILIIVGAIGIISSTGISRSSR